MHHGSLRVPPLRRVTFGKRPKSNQKVLALPYGRLAKARRCPHSGTVMGARRDGPSMAHRGWRGVLPRHPHNSACVRPSVMGIRVVWTSAWLQQKKKKNRSWARVHTVCKTGRLVSHLGEVLDLVFDFDLPAHHRRPNAGAVMGVARQDAAPAAMGHGWPVAACPHNSAGVRAPASLGEAAVW